MGLELDIRKYAAKMRRMVSSGIDMEVEARFVDSIAKRRARVLDIGCGIGTAVNALRGLGHEAYGIDPADEVLQVARDLYEPSWYRKLGATEGSRGLQNAGLPTEYDVVLMSGNVPYFLDPDELSESFSSSGRLLAPGGMLVVGTTAAVRGGPRDQDLAVQGSGLSLVHRFADWHLAPFGQDSPWSVGVYRSKHPGTVHAAPDGMFILQE